ncbi:unnamed protein product [Microthlaspi erraticum]|uniref:Uncharacterized protein n=1 Tax=Microthlaspi erraticum TaxID=1685480 RepID=A0A6D2J2Z7_9BRAS|nr:unnamed protein product [Microthlaspi erraticum]
MTPSTLLRYTSTPSMTTTLSPIPNKMIRAPPNSKQQKLQEERGRPQSHLPQPQRMFPHHPPQELSKCVLVLSCLAHLIVLEVKVEPHHLKASWLS